MSQLGSANKAAIVTPGRSKTPTKRDSVTASVRSKTPSKISAEKSKISVDKTKSAIKMSSPSPNKPESRRNSLSASKKHSESDLSKLRKLPDYTPPTTVDGVVIGKDRKLKEVNKRKIFREVATNLVETNIQPDKLLFFLQKRCEAKKDMFDYDYSRDTNLMNLRFCIYLLTEELETLINNLDESQGSKYIHSFDAKLNKRNEIINYLLKEKGITIKIFTKLISILTNTIAEMGDIQALVELMPEFKEKNRFISKLKVLLKELEMIEEFKSYTRNYFNEKDLMNLITVQREVKDPLTREEYVKIRDFVPMFDKLDRYGQLMEDFKTLTNEMAMKEENYMRLLNKYEQLLKDYNELTNKGADNLMNPLGPDDYERIFQRYREVKAEERKDTEAAEARLKAEKRAAAAAKRKQSAKKKKKKSGQGEKDGDENEKTSPSRSPSKPREKSKKNTKKITEPDSDEDSSQLESPKFGEKNQLDTRGDRRRADDDPSRGNRLGGTSPYKRQPDQRGTTYTENYDHSDYSSPNNSFHKPHIPEVDLSKISKSNTPQGTQPVVPPLYKKPLTANQNNTAPHMNDSNTHSNSFQKNQPVKTKGETTMPLSSGANPNGNTFHNSSTFGNNTINHPELQQPPATATPTKKVASFAPLPQSPSNNQNIPPKETPAAESPKKPVTQPTTTPSPPPPPPVPEPPQAASLPPGVPPPPPLSMILGNR